MDMDPETFFQTLSRKLENPSECERLLKSFNRYLIEEQIDSSIIDIYLVQIFHSSTGLLVFINATVPKKNFKNSTGKAVEILYTLLNNFPDLLSEKNILDIYKICIKISRSNCDHHVKMKVFDLLLLSFDKIDKHLESKDLAFTLKELLTSVVNGSNQNHTPSVKEKELQILGGFAKKFGFLVDQPDTLKTAFMRNLDFTRSARSMSQNLLNGLFEGFTAFCESFPLKPESEDKATIDKIYKLIKEVAIIKEKERKMGSRAALKYLAKHTLYFEVHLMKDYRFWHEKLLLWLSHNSNDDKRAGFSTLNSFFEIIFMALEKSDSNDGKVMFEFFHQWSVKILENKQTYQVSNHERHLAISCINQSAVVSRKYLSSKDFHSFFITVMQTFENTYILNGNIDMEDWEYMPDYIKTLSNFIRLKTVTSTEYFCLQRGVIDMIKSFHKLPYLHHNIVVDALVTSLFYFKKSQYFDAFVQNVIYTGVVWTCSHQHLSNANQETSEKVITVDNYFPLWLGVLKLSINTSYEKLGSYSDRKSMVARVAKELVKSLLILLNKLNISVQLKDEHSALTDLEHVFKVKQPNDYAIFLNVVDFYEKIFDVIEPKLFGNCICRILKILINKCLQHPLTSGFYKLLSFNLRVSKKLCLFDVKTDENQGVRSCQEHLHSFIVILLHKMPQYKDELLMACLRVLLESPVGVIKEILPDCVNPLKNIFDVGRSYLSLAEMGLDTLEYWQETIDSDIFEPVLEKLIPNLDTFLRSKSLGGQTASVLEKRRKTTQALRKRKVIVELQPELIRLQKRILFFVGRQSVKICRTFIFSDNVYSKAVLSGDKTHLKVALPYQDGNLDIYMDMFFPKIIDLSLHCSDRKTRIVACELLQALVVIFLGRAKSMSVSSLTDLDTILKMFAMPLLQLACDIDQVVQQIFEPLFLQLIHWYSSRTQIGGTHCAIMIEVLMEGITHPTNSALRDFSGSCVNEFVKWSIKQSSDKTLASNPSTIKLFVRRMRFYSFHPDPSKQLGAVLMFNSVYRVLREEECLISIFWIELLHIFVNSLSNIEYIMDENILFIQIKTALQHLKRVFVEKPQIFRKTDDKREVPKDLGKGTLECVAIWLLKQTTNKNRYTRESCMELFLNIAPLYSVEKVKMASFITKHFDKNSIPSLTDVSVPCEANILFGWMNNFLLILDVYNFQLQNNVLVGDDILLKGVHIFLQNLPDTSASRDKFVQVKSLCVLSILKLYRTTLHNEVLNAKSSQMWCEDSWELIKNTLFSPNILGITYLNESDYRDLITILLNIIPDKLPASKTTQLNQMLDSYIKDNFDVSINLKSNMDSKRRDLIKGILLLNSTKVNRQLKVEKYAEGVIDQIMKDFTESHEDGIIFIDELQESVQTYCEMLIKFSLNNDVELLRFFNYLYTHYKVRSADFAEEISFGLYLLHTFTEAVVPCILSHFKEFLDFSVDKGDMRNVVELIIFLLNIFSKQTTYNVYYERVCDELSQKWTTFVEFFDISTKNKCLGVEYTKMFLQICPRVFPGIPMWLVQCLMTDDGSSTLELFNLLVHATDEQSSQSSENLETALMILMERIREKNADDTLLDKMILTIPSVKSSKIMCFLMKSYVHIESKLNLDQYLNQFVNNSDEALQEQIINCIYDLSCESTSFDIRYKLAKKVLCTLLQFSTSSVVEKFYIQKINTIVEQLEGNNFEVNIVNFLLIEILFLRVTVAQEECPIAKASNQPNLLRSLMKSGLDTFNVKDGDEIIRLFKCHAYNALASIISNSPKLKGFYDKMFVRQDKSNDILWNGIVKMNFTYQFPIKFDKIPDHRKVFINIRDEFRMANAATSGIHSLKYMESQRLFNSSLSEDVTKYDFSNVMVRTEKPNEDRNNNCQSEIFLEATDINEHECMAVVCGLIQHIFKTGTNKVPEKDEDEIALPSWMKGIRETLLNRDTHNNVKIFLVKVIDNVIDYFNPFAKYFLEPLLQFIVDECAGQTINYFVMDVLIIVTKWASVVDNLSEREKTLSSEMLNMLIKKVNLERRDIFKLNLDIVKLIVESWKSFIQVPKRTVHKLIEADSTTEVGIQIASIFLVNDLKLWETNQEKMFFNLLMSKLKSSSKSVYKPCSELLGVLMKHLNGDSLEQLRLYLKDVKDFDKYLVCLEGIVIHYPLIVDIDDASKLISRLNQFSNKQKIVHLKIICKRISESLDILEETRDFSIVDWDKLLEDGDLEIQIICLEIVKKCLNKFVTYTSFRDVIRTLKMNVTNPNALYRSSMYDLAILLYQSTEHFKEDAKDILIHGLADTDIDNCEKVRKFWTSDANLPRTVVEILPFVLSEMYNSKIEDQFLGYVIFFLMDVLKWSHHFNSILFENPLENCTFEEYKLITNWRLQHPSTVPMFVETLQTLDDVHFSDESDFHHLRGTQTAFTFKPTQSIHEQQLSKFTSLESSLDWHSGISGNANMKNPNDMVLSQKYRHKTRFLEDKSKISRSFAHHETKKKYEKVQKRFDLAKEREKKVTIYRNYRKGDFPDIQIPLSSFIEPLQVLALHDHEVSKLLFIEIFKGLANKVEDKEDFLPTVLNSIENIFNNSTSFNTHLINALLEILLMFKDKIQLKPELITKVCQQSGLTSVGTLLLEEYILHRDDCYEPEMKKGSGSQENTDTVKFWVKLADLYKDLEEWDVVRAIFLEKMNCKETIQEALKFESEEVWRLAQESYVKLIKNDMSSERKDFYYDSYFKCFAHLGEWEKLPKAIDSLVDSNNVWEVLWDDSWYQQKLLPWYIVSHVRNGLFSGRFDQGFLECINSCLSDSQKAEYLKSKFSEELSMMWLFEKDTSTARVYLQNYINYFLEEWQHLNPMYHTLRFNKLLEMKNIIETDDFINIYNNLSECWDNSLKTFTGRWRTEMLPSILSNETRVVYRTQFIDLLIDKLKTFSIDAKDTINTLKKEKMKMEIDFINIATSFDNFYIARKYYGKYKNYEHSKLKLAYGNIVVSKIKSRNFSKAEEFKMYLDAVKIFKSILDPSLNHVTALAVNSKLFDLYSRTTSMLNENLELLENYQDDLNAIFGTSIKNSQYIENHAIDILKSSIERFDEAMDTDSVNHDVNRDIAEAYIKMAYFIQNRNYEDRHEDFVVFVLRAMRLNSPKARKLFPCILLLDNLGTNCKSVFQNEAEGIPTWMFLGWIPQLLAVLDSPKISAISKVIIRIAETYPQSIMYAYRLSRANYTLDNVSNIQNEVNPLLNRLNELLLSDKNVDMLLEALSFVKSPYVTLNSYVNKMCRENNVKKLLDELNELDRETSLRGKIYKVFDSYKSRLAKLKGMSQKSQKQKLEEMRNELIERKQSECKQPRLLKDYCPWLANFAGNKLNIELEIPGQYDGLKMPLPQHHVKIFGFCPDVKIMSSLRQPIKIKMLGMDAKEYPFLIKCGEDIRQDQRIQQLFGLMNDIYATDKCCANNGFDILTYQVIPLTSNLGIIQWIDDTIPLKDFVVKLFSKEKKAEELLAKTRTDYDKFVTSALIYSTCPEKYVKVIPKLSEFINRFPKDMLKKSFEKFSVNVENYIALRNNFIKTYSVLCVSQWILGIGDRHLNNFLVCVNNGKVLGIDFGHAFGSATQIQSIPELVPFRLTPHIINLMEPLKERGQFKENMIHCLRALRDNHDSLIATMNVFIQEPTLDWLERAGSKDEDEKTDVRWNAKNKILQATRKICGAPSTKIMMEELDARPKAESAIGGWKKIVRGCDNNVRAKFDGSDYLSVEDQVECLIDHATDYNLLGRMFGGWSPWI